MQLSVPWPAPASIRALASQKALDFLRPSKTQFIKNNPNNTGNNTKSQVKNKKGRSISLWNYQLLPIVSNHFLVILLEGANREQSSQNNYSKWCPPLKSGRDFFKKKKSSSWGTNFFGQKDLWGDYSKWEG